MSPSAVRALIVCLCLFQAQGLVLTAEDLRSASNSSTAKGGDGTLFEGGETVRRENSTSIGTYRKLTASEKSYAKVIFKTSVDLDKVHLYRDSVQSVGAPKTIGNGVHLQSTWGSKIFTSSKPTDPMTLTKAGKELLIHELGHVWQYQNGGVAYIVESLAAQAGAHMGSGSRNDAYDWEKVHKAGMDWTDWNPEQQAAAIEDYNRALRAGNTATTTTLQPYIDKVREGIGAAGFIWDSDGRRRRSTPTRAPYIHWKDYSDR